MVEPQLAKDRRQHGVVGVLKLLQPVCGRFESGIALFFVPPEGVNDALHKVRFGFFDEETAGRTLFVNVERLLKSGHGFVKFLGRSKRIASGKQPPGEGSISSSLKGSLTIKTYGAKAAKKDSNTFHRAMIEAVKPCSER